MQARTVAVVGAGAMGTLFGARLALRGHDVHMIDVDARLLAAIAEAGLELEDDAGTHRANVHACTAVEARFRSDVLIVFTKSMHTGNAMAATRHLVDCQTCVLTVQNGLGNVEALEASVPRDQIVYGMTNLPVDPRGPGRAASHGTGEIRVADLEGSHGRAAALAELLSHAGLPCRNDGQVEVAIWEKVAFNSAVNAIAALSRCTVGAIGQSDAGRALSRRVVAEVAAVARARGIAVDIGRIEQALLHAFENHVSHRPSMLQDILANRETEIDYLNGAIARLAGQANTPAPVNETLCQLISLLRSGRN